MRALNYVFFSIVLVAAESQGFCQQMDVDVLMSNGGITYDTTQNNQEVTIRIVGPDDPYDVNHMQKIELRIDGREIEASRETIIRIVKAEIANNGEKLSTARQSTLSLIMTTLLTDLKIKRWGFSLFSVLHEGNWQYAFVERDPPIENYDYGAPMISEKETERSKGVRPLKKVKRGHKKSKGVRSLKTYAL